MLCWWGPTSPKQLSRALHLFSLGITWYFLHVFWGSTAICKNFERQGIIPPYKEVSRFLLSFSFPNTYGVPEVVFLNCEPLCSALQSGYPSPELGELLEADSYGSLVLSRLCLFSGNITDPAEARFNTISLFSSYLLSPLSLPLSLRLASLISWGQVNYCIRKVWIT